MASAEQAYLELADALARCAAGPGGLGEVRGLLHLLRRCTDAGYPNVPPPERLGHEFARDALSVLAGLREAPAPPPSPDAPQQRPMPPSPGARWQALFPAGTALGLSPFEADALIRRRRAQVCELDAEVALLSRRVARLRGLPVRMH
ncbi:hypothetical protein GL50803_00116712 [Giardia duodenalis]|uniref:Uncharacterized protein n=1 Tax=Giardia intestinalis (strain ATCC 50803 / WB clone C6) TaxID=184922 RepID=A8BS55_GIAIC|nr:hypothetical protein GL50803_00116713 [Giardia intestinalis]XP_001705154.1 hypothetical protein GL50803_00116712 [Giardia intestinalis]KAE8304722.1 hypothetical protein GL50803_00116713 [Giardia intestinalis]KAE8304747.1 hypothetical protein GL50803_00116712 [Giardia intestinalis]|eukprot:XP_001705123.1 Hypothetical protein GL50803_116713 [Giardia lamblia ATCC 50803]